MGAITIIVVVVTGASAKSGGVIEWEVGLLDASRWYWTQMNRLETRPPFVVWVLVCDMEIEVGVHRLIINNKLV